MPRRTKADIEQLLLAGSQLDWTDAGKSASIRLASAEERRVLKFLLESEIRNPKELPAAFITGLKAAIDGDSDPATKLTNVASTTIAITSWRLARIETEGFGGINTWKSSPFSYDFDCESTLIEGPNGSGKSSLVAAIIWCLSGYRPRDGGIVQAPNDHAPVFTLDGSTAGTWPPIACYPPESKFLTEIPSVLVRLTFRNEAGVEALVTRTLSGGRVSYSANPLLNIPPILMETGLFMPSRLGHIRFAEKEGSLSEAIQMLTGLDAVADLGTFVSELCHGGREFLSYAKQLRRDEKIHSFDAALQEARTVLRPLNQSVPQFKPSATMDKSGPMAILMGTLEGQAKNLLGVISADLAPGLDIGLLSDQQKVANAIDRAKEEVAQGLVALPSWTICEEISRAMDESNIVQMETLIANATKSIKRASQLAQISVEDTKYRLKAAAANWHAQHVSGDIENCPLCERSLKENQDLTSELEALRNEGEMAARTFSDNINAIVAEVENGIPQSIRRYRSDVLGLEPGRSYEDGLRSRYVNAERYRQCLSGLSILVDTALNDCPKSVISISPGMTLEQLPPSSQAALDAIGFGLRLMAVARWVRAVHPLWTTWWNNLAGSEEEPLRDTLRFKIVKLNDAVNASAPFRIAAKALDSAWKAGQAIAQIDVEQETRQRIADAMSPLKNLKKFVDAESKEAIDGLSSRMAKTLEQIHVIERLRFRSAHFDRRAGVTVRAGLAPELAIDATLVANVSWLRALLWAFLFSVREEAIEQLGRDPFPLCVFDDPQATFDITHRHRWAQYVAALQKAPANVQIILTTHDSPFAEELVVATVSGRRVELSSAGPDTGNLYVIEGSALVRAWIAAKQSGTQKAAIDYIADVRVHVESMLKLMMRGEINPQVTVIGDLRERLRQLHENKAPLWFRPPFGRLLASLNKAEIRYLESSHHTTGRALSLSHAQDVEKFWTKELAGHLNSCFYNVREHRLMHGDSKALHAAPPTANFPPGHRDIVRTIPLQVYGRAAALTNGRIADGEMTLVELAESARERVVLGHHDVFRLAYPRLEPVAREGDLLVVTEDENPPSGSLVVAVFTDQLLARRFQVSADHPEVAVLTAQANNPMEIASPVIAHISTVKLRKVIGVLFDPRGAPVTAPTNCEVVDCGGDDAITKVKSGTFGLVEVSGDSAQPQVLDGQFLLIRDAVSPQVAIQTLDGRPVIATDSDNHQYFKRLRAVSAKNVVLESLNSAGDSPPVLLNMPGEPGTTIERVWPVVGVLFERP